MSVLGKRSRDDPRRAATERAFHEATMSLLEEGLSFADLNVSRIAERAGRTRTAFYAHFEDRRELLLALLEQVGDDVVDALAPFLAIEGPVDLDAITSATRAALATFRENATLVRALIEAAGYDDEVARYWAGIVDRIVDGAQPRLQAEGLGAAEARAMATALTWMSERLCYQQAVRGATGLDDEAVVQAISQLWWRTVRTIRDDAR
ncbi:MAG TPA: TetR/AcrR family transcriptional regulator [Baekduia sp.]|nr:TetR/AcrR family transcriptional regulator [Baekduia sp.]